MVKHKGLAQQANIATNCDGRDTTWLKGIVFHCQRTWKVGWSAIAAKQKISLLNFSLANAHFNRIVGTKAGIGFTN